MIRYKKIIIGIIVLALFSCSVFMIYNVNSVFPNTDEKIYRTGDETRYRGLKLTVGEMNIYTEDEFAEKYPDTKDINEMFNYENAKNYVVVNITLENDTDENIQFGKFGSVTGWVVETCMNANGIDNFVFSVLNPSYSRLILSGAKKEIILPFEIPEEWATYDELRESDKKIIYSLYPTKSYILLEGEEK